MAEQVVPTKGNLLTTKKYLGLSTLGFDLLDRKRNILVRELMLRIDEARELKGQVREIFDEAYRALQQANITLGVIEPLAERLPVAGGIEISYRSVMGVELPGVTLREHIPDPAYSLLDTNSRLDYAYCCFMQVRALSGRLAEVENSIYRLTSAIKKTQRRANALKNIIIPRFEDNVKFITDSLEEKEREEFSRLKVLKKNRG
ncbi:V-type ATP synthase subunit D [Intestinibacillus massiliensis]|uniref:V-type ATP synthase subunit D n=1 Tax=Intestinibacillus massiliensis TaxID=1871029 RepID=UPI000B35A664|nr:V-type ATP synthase subunit D [Intestinibacillus massiliensis]